MRFKIYFLIILWHVVVAYKKSFIDSAESVGKKYGSAVFTAWEMTISDKASAQQLKDKICLDLKKLQKQKHRQDHKAVNSRLDFVLSR